MKAICLLCLLITCGLWRLIPLFFFIIIDLFHHAQVTNNTRKTQREGGEEALGETIGQYNTVEPVVTLRERRDHFIQVAQNTH